MDFATSFALGVVVGCSIGIWAYERERTLNRHRDMPDAYRKGYDDGWEDCLETLRNRKPPDDDPADWWRKE